MKTHTQGPNRQPTPRHSRATTIREVGIKAMIAAGLLTGGAIYVTEATRIADNAPTVQPFKEKYEGKVVPGAENVTLLPGHELSEAGKNIYLNENDRIINENHTQQLAIPSVETPVAYPSSGPTLEQVEGRANQTGAETPANG